MNYSLSALLFPAIYSAISGRAFSVDEKEACTTDVVHALMTFVKKHDIGQLVALGLKNNGIVAGVELESEIFKSVYRCETQSFELKRICEGLEAAKIPFLPLKGSVIRKYYPEPWMRTSCDIDVLVHERDSEKAKSVLVDKYGYVYHEKGSHDVSLFSPTNIHVELHYNLVEDGRANEASEVLKNVWEVSCVREGFGFWYEMPDEMFYFYHIAHMVKHFEYGGCGIRPFIDIWILDGLKGADKEKRDKLLQQGNLLKFANAARKLSRIWFSGEPYDYISQQMADYILSGGVYGNDENRITVQQQKNGGRIRYALSKIFLSYDVIKFHYPILQKYRALTPFMEVRRWGKLIFCGHAKRTLRELNFNRTISSDTVRETRELLNKLGL